MKRRLLILALVAICAQGFAQSSTDLGSWLHVTAIKSFGKPYAMARLEHRSYENMRSTECWFAMAGGGYRFTPWLTADLSYEYWKLPVAGNKETHKAVACVTGTLAREGLAVSLKEKYEMSFEQDGSIGGTIRSRLRAQYHPASSRFTPYVIFEYFVGNDGKWIRSLHYAGTDLRLSDHHSLDFYYMYHLYPRGSALAATNILGIGYTLVF